MTLLRLAQGNDGIVSRAEAIEAGCSRAAIQRRVDGGFLIPVFPSVYRIAAHPDTHFARVRAAYRWGGQGAVLAAGTALSVFGIDGLNDHVDLYVATGKSIAGIKTRRLPLDPLRTRPIKGMVATSIERALLDACSRYPATKVGRTMDEVLRLQLTTVDRLRSSAPKDPRGVRGAKNFSSLLRGRDLNDQQVRSEMESRMLQVLRKIKGHFFVANYEVRGNDGRYFLDFALPQARLAIECQSRTWHGAEQATSDANRHNDLTSLGWTVLYFTWDDIVFHPCDVQRRIERLLKPSFPLPTR